MIRLAPLPQRRPWPMILAVAIGIGAAWTLVPVLQQAEQYRTAGPTVPETDFWSRLFGLSASAQEVSEPSFYQLPDAKRADADAHARTTLVTAQCLDLIKDAGGTVLQVGVDAPLQQEGQVRVPARLVWQGDFASMQTVVSGMERLSPTIGWAHCRMAPIEDFDEPDPARRPRQLLRIELGFVTSFHLAGPR